MKISEMDDEQRRDYLDRAYQAGCELHSNGELEGPHPSRILIGWAKAAKARAAGSADANGNGRTESEMLENRPDAPFRANTGVPRAEPRLSVDSVPITSLEAALLAGMARDERRTADMESVGVPGYSRLK